MYTYKLTKIGFEEVNWFIDECNAKRKEILDAGLDTADDTIIPTVESILYDIEQYVDEDGDYYNGWGVTDSPKYDIPLFLKLGQHFVENEDLVHIYNQDIYGKIEEHRILKYPNGKYYNHYSWDEKRQIGNSVAGGYDTEAEAIIMLNKHRPTSYKII